ncbi:MULTISPECIES: PLP-dependent aspartate aminotransferase family protein [unclassified Microbacterium]|uniref:trans-sulfuration enzyme family protein n=1 Tax=unclassified Microbacterium TaxID=2609290 RepID=UPI000EA9221E|nr:MULTISPECIES: PLP-dependent aspartate aminotransferase family protein [unclassified Microbacterium]MBT2484017.1 PLP-dependent transferase [Microbacterium sp. ISL-108]RKN66975.1 PLP-dependent transferase [Microbacterium sp. CGR2]
MDFETRLTRIGRTTAAAAHAISPPLVRTSTTVFASLTDYRRAQRGVVFAAPRYGRSGTTTTFELQQAMAEISRAETAIATSSGLAAITAVLSAHAGAGRHILVSAGVYGPTRVFCDRELIPAGTEVEYFARDDDLSALLRDDTSLVFVETPASLTMEMLDIRAISEAAHAHGVPLASDSTWGTPVFFDAHSLGVDISVHSATKFINGHSDLLLGLVTGSSDALERVREYCDRNGTHAAPDTCWLALRGLRTLALRMQRHEASALTVAVWMQHHPGVRRVLFPALEGDPGYELWRSQFTGAAGPFTIELPPCSEADFAVFIDHLQLFGLGTSWGGFESLIMPAEPHHLRADDGAPDAPRLVRLHVGLESAGDLIEDLDSAFSAAGMVT